MYLSDHHLRKLLPQLHVETEDGLDAFNPEDQVQPASIDLRLSSVYWRPSRRSRIDLRRSQLLEIQPRRYYRRVALTHGETIDLRPRELLLGRTAEEFTVPNGFVAELVGRSSFARLGLMVTAAGGHINPGWRGRMPLQLVNFSPNSIRLVTGLPVCQVRFAQLTDLAEHPYGDPALGSIYLDDDGGPSFWWRDKRIQELHERLAEKSVEVRIQRRLESVIGPCEPEVIERLDRHIARTRVAEITNAESLLHDFAGREDQRRTRRRWSINVMRGSLALGFGTGLFVANQAPPILWWHWALLCMSAGVICLSIFAFRTEVGDHFGEAELRESRTRREGQEESPPFTPVVGRDRKERVE